MAMPRKDHPAATRRRIALLGVLMALCAQGHAAQVCSWDNPGVNPYMGEVPAAVDRYREIPAPVRARLKERMARLDYDEIAEIRRDSIEGKSQRYGNLRGMHFGQGGYCETVTRAKWAEQHKERGLVYCDGEHCIIVPTVCRNVSRIDALPAGERDTPPVVLPDEPRLMSHHAAHIPDAPDADALNDATALQPTPWGWPHWYDSPSPAQPTRPTQPDAHTVPEPSSLALALCGLLLTTCTRRTKQ